MSTTGLFQSSREDGRSDWRVVFDLVEKLQFGEEIEHATLLTELDTKDRNRMYRAVGRANRELWATRSRSLAVVKGHGYKMLRAEENEILANSYRKQARRKMGSAVAVMDATDLAELNDRQREWAVKVQGGLRMLAAAMDEHAAKLTRHEELINSLQQRIGKLESK